MSPNLRPECSIITTQQLDAPIVPSTHYVFNNCVYFQSHLVAGTSSIAIDLMTMNDIFRSIGHQHSDISSCWLLWTPAMILAFHVKICRINILQFMSTFGRNIALPLENLGPVTIFNTNIVIYWRHRGHRHLISPTLHGCTANSEMRYLRV